MPDDGTAAADAAQKDKAEGRVDSTSDERTANNTDAVRHNYRVLTDQEKLAMVAVKDAGAALLAAFDKYCHPSRETSLARTKAEEAVMWAVKGITT